MQLLSQISASTLFRSFVASPPLTGSDYPAAFRQSSAEVRREAAAKQEVLLFDLLQQALAKVDLLLQCKCIAFDLQMAMDEKVLAETSSFVLLLETLIGLAVESAPTGACITIVAERVQHQVVIVVREESARMGDSTAERLIHWFTSNKPKLSFNPAQVAAAQCIAGQHGGNMTIHASHKACLIVQIPLI